MRNLQDEDQFDNLDLGHLNHYEDDNHIARDKKEQKRQLLLYNTSFHKETLWEWLDIIHKALAYDYLKHGSEGLFPL